MKKYADGGMMPPKPMPKPPMEDPAMAKGLDSEISPEALEMMKQKKREMEREKRQRMMEEEVGATPMRKGGKVKKMAKGGKVGSASKRGDGCAQRGKTKGRMV